jgi:extradiol dioxygenase family protein
MATTAGIIELENTLTKTRLYNEEINFNIISNICLYGKCTRSKTLSLKDAITYALENKSDAKKARLKVENSKYQIQEVRSSLTYYC